MAVNHSYELLAAYLSGNISIVDKASVENWITESQENQLLFEEVQKVWNSSGVYLQYNDLDSSHLLHELTTRITEEQRPAGKVISMMKSYKLYWRVAAGICLLVVSYFIVRWASRDDINI